MTNGFSQKIGTVMSQHVQVYEDSQDLIVISSDFTDGKTVEASSILHLNDENAEKIAIGIMQILQDKLVRKTQILKEMKEQQEEEELPWCGW